MDLGAIKKRHRYHRDRHSSENVRCPRCGTSHHWDLSCAPCMSNLVLDHAVHCYERLSKNLMENPDAKVREYMHDLGSIMNGFRELAQDVASKEQNAAMGIRFMHMSDMFPELKSLKEK